MSTTTIKTISVIKVIAAYFTIAFLLTLLTGCASSPDGSGGTPIGISIPIPPSGEHAGDLGYFRLGYEPNYLGTYNYALRAFQEPKPTSTK